MKGFRTIVFGLVVAVAPAALHYLAGVDWTQIVGPVFGPAVVGAITIGLRMVTDTAVGSKS